MPKTDSYLLSVAVQVRTPLSVLRLPQLAADRNCEDENSHGHPPSSGHCSGSVGLVTDESSLQTRSLHSHSQLKKRDAGRGRGHREHAVGNVLSLGKAYQMAPR